MACEGWVILPINMVVGLRREKSDPRLEGALPFVGMDDIEPHGLKVLRTRPFAEMRSLGNRFRAGDVLYGRLRPYLNKTAVADGNGACSGELLVFEPTPAIEARYLQYYLHSQRFVGWISATTSGDRPRVGFETIAGFAIPLAPAPRTTPHRGADRRVVRGDRGRRGGIGGRAQRPGDLPSRAAQGRRIGRIDEGIGGRRIRIRDGRGASATYRQGVRAKHGVVFAEPLSLNHLKLRASAQIASWLGMGDARRRRRYRRAA